MQSDLNLASSALTRHFLWRTLESLQFTIRQRINKSNEVWAGDYLKRNGGIITDENERIICERTFKCKAFKCG